jgi:hypothetical protein
MSAPVTGKVAWPEVWPADCVALTAGSAAALLVGA